MVQLDDKVAVIVGGGLTEGSSVSMGAAIAMRFATEGARVVVVDVNNDAAERTVAAIKAEGRESRSVVADARKEDDCLRLAEFVGAEFGGLDILVNNIGVWRNDADPISLSLESWNALLEVNLTAQWLSCKALVPQLRRRPMSSVILISSVGAIQGNPGTLAYGVSKAGVNALVQTLANQNGPFGLRVNAIMPGAIDTPMGADVTAEMLGLSRVENLQQRRLRHVLPRTGTSWDIAAAALFYASDESAFITGTALAVDGGEVASWGNVWNRP